MLLVKAEHSACECLVSFGSVSCKLKDIAGWTTVFKYLVVRFIKWVIHHHKLHVFLHVVVEQYV